MYWGDKYGTQSVSPKVVGEMREILSQDNNNIMSNSFLLDDDLSIPFSTDDISKTIRTPDPMTIELPASLSDWPIKQDKEKDPRILTNVGDFPVQEISNCDVDDDRLMNVISDSVKLVVDEDLDCYGIILHYCLYGLYYLIFLLNLQAHFAQQVTLLPR